MQQQSGSDLDNPATYSTRIDKSGRIVIPSELRERLHFQPGDELVVREDAGTISISSYDRILAEAQAYFMSLVEPGVSMVDELIAERRAEAARETAEEAGQL